MHPEAPRSHRRDAGATRVSGRPRGGFTLIEILVVVAIIALLIAILMPSLARARAMARLVQCQVNMRQLVTGFVTYSVTNKNRMPGMRGDRYADWLGADNRPGLPGLTRGRQPEDGTVFKYVGKDKQAYVCPEDQAPRLNLAPESSKYSYTASVLIDGARTEMLSDGHYRKNPNPKDSSNFSETNHGADMRPFGGVPVLIEEDPEYYLVNVDDSAWCNADCVTDRHLKLGADRGWGNIAFHDTHVGRLQLLPRSSARAGEKWFTANSMCIRTTGGKWVSGRSWGSAYYGYMDHAIPARDSGVNGHD
ncbi:MAG: prepilin-type N-terminal cleavage/methylation domain-containing protein [Phycisphaerae bacterium]